MLPQCVLNRAGAIRGVPKIIIDRYLVVKFMEYLAQKKEGKRRKKDISFIWN
jgi:hypothetical protein